MDSAPRERLLCVRFISAESQPSRIVIDKDAAAIEIGMRMSANAVFLFQKLDCIFRSGLPLIEGMYPEFSLRKAAAPAQLIVQIGL